MSTQREEFEVGVTGASAASAAIQKLTSAFAGMAAGAKGLYGSLAALAGAGGFALVVKHSLETADAFGKLAASAGISTESLSRLAWAAEQAGVSNEELAVSAKTLNSAIVKNDKALQDMGIAVRDAHGEIRPFDDVLDDVADKMVALGEGPRRAQLAFDLLGRSGTRMIPMLKDGKEGLAKLKEEAQKLGLVVSTEFAQRAEAVNDSINAMGARARGAAMVMTEALLPAIEQLVIAMESIAPAGAGLATIRDVFESIAKTAGQATHAVVFWAGVFGNVGKTLFPSSPYGVANPIDIIKKGWSDYTTEVGKMNAKEGAQLGPGALKNKGGKGGGLAVPLPTSASPEAMEQYRALGIEGARGALKYRLETQQITLEEYAGKSRDLINAEYRVEMDHVRRTAELETDDAKRKQIQLDGELLAEGKHNNRSMELNRELLAAQQKHEDEMYDAARNTFLKIQDLRRQEYDEKKRKIDEDFRLDRHQKRAALTGLADEYGQDRPGGPDPNNVGEQVDARLAEARSKLHTFAEGVGEVMDQTIGAAINGISDSIQGLIKGTMDWGDALRNIGSSILDGVISAFSRMFAEWIVGRLLMQQTNQAASTAEGATDAAAKAPGALFSSISSWGAAAAIGLAALGVALAGISGAFAEGGRPPTGRPALVGEQGPELFIPDVAGTIIPAGMTSQFLSERHAAPARVGMSGAAQGGRGQQFVIVDNRRQARDYAMSTEFETRLVDVVSNGPHLVGLRR